MMKKKSGFTLAEVLTTLMVIGVVAAMTIPTLMNSTDDQQNKVAYKKAMSVLSQGIQMLTAQENECYDEISTQTQKAPALASCMSSIMSGSLNVDEITTLDGMVYKFYVDESRTSATTLEELCGQTPDNTPDGWMGGGSCGIVVDTNGHAKGTKSFPAAITFNQNGFNEQPSPKDLLTFVLGSNGVRPTYQDGEKNKGYEYMYGTATEAPYRNVKMCYKVDANGVQTDSKQITNTEQCDTANGWTETRPTKTPASNSGTK